MVVASVVAYQHSCTIFKRSRERSAGLSAVQLRLSLEPNVRVKLISLESAIRYALQGFRVLGF